MANPNPKNQTAEERAKAEAEAKAKKDAEEKANNNGQAKKAKALEIVSRGEQFRRCGISFSREPKTIPVSRLKKEVADRLKEEPNLIVKEVEIDAPKSK